MNRNLFSVAPLRIWPLFYTPVRGGAFVFKEGARIEAEKFALWFSIFYATGIYDIENAIDVYVEFTQEKAKMIIKKASGDYQTRENLGRLLNGY